jgi:hypothetical protein
VFERFIARQAILKDNLTEVSANGQKRRRFGRSDTGLFVAATTRGRRHALTGRRSLCRAGPSKEQKAREHSLAALFAIERSTCAFYPAFSPSIAAM